MTPQTGSGCSQRGEGRQSAERGSSVGDGDVDGGGTGGRIVVGWGCSAAGGEASENEEEDRKTAEVTQHVPAGKATPAHHEEEHATYRRNDKETGGYGRCGTGCALQSGDLFCIDGQRGVERSVRAVRDKCGRREGAGHVLGQLSAAHGERAGIAVDGQNLNRECADGAGGDGESRGGISGSGEVRRDSNANGDGGGCR